MTPDNQDDPQDDSLDIDSEFPDVADDAADYDDDAEIYDDSWDENETPPAAAKKTKKKSSLFTILIIVGAVVIGAVILLTQLGKARNKDSNLAPSQEQMTSSPAPASATLTDSADQNSIPANDLMAMKDSSEVTQNANNSTDDAKTPAAQPQGFMNDPSALKKEESAEIQTPDLPEQPSMTGFADDTKPADTNSAQDQAQAATPLPNIDQIKKAEPAFVETPPLPVPTEIKIAEPAPVAAPAPVAVVAPVVAPVAAIPDPAIQKKLEEALTRIETLEKKLAERPVSAVESSNPSQVADLRADVARLEDQITKLNAAKSSSSVYNDDKEEFVAKKPVPRKKKAARPSEFSSSYVPERFSARKPVQTGKWELRSARPGEAMIGKSGEAGLTTVRVGDTVPGIGQITAISQVGTTWIIQGSASSVTQ